MSVMNEDFFTGFERSYLFFDEKNDFMFLFHTNNFIEAYIEEVTYVGKWRYHSKRNIVEIFIQDLNLKVIYKFTPPNGKEDSLFFESQFSLKYIDDDTKNKNGVTSFLRKVNDISETEVDSKEEKLERILVISFFFGLFLIVLLLASILPFFSNFGVLYLSALILTIQIIFLKKIRSFVRKYIVKYKDKLNSIFFE